MSRKPLPRMESNANESRRRARVGRWVLRGLVALGALVVLLVASVFAILQNLERPVVKRRIQSAVQSTMGIEIDYRAIRFTLLHGLAVDDVVVRSPAEFRSIAPELARIGHVEARWSMALFTGAGRRVEHVALSNVALTMAIDEHGKTSLDALSPSSPAPAPPAPSTPLSKKPRELLALAPLLPAADVRDVTIKVVRIVAGERGPVVERDELRGLQLHVHAEPVADEWHVRASLGSGETPVELGLSRTLDDAPAGEAVAKLHLNADATADDVVATLDVQLAKQTFGPQLAVTHLAHVEARSHFDEAAGKTTITLNRATLADDIASSEASIDLPDHGAPLLRHAEGQIDFARLVALLPRALVPLEARIGRGQLEYRVDGLDLEALPRLNEGSKASVEGDLAGIEIPEVARIASAKLSARIEPGTSDSLRARANVDLESAEAKVSGRSVRVDGLKVEADATQIKGGVLNGNVSLALSTLDAAGAERIAAKGAKLGVRFGDLVVDADAPLATRGDVTITSEVGTLDVRTPGNRTTLERLSLRAHAAPTGREPLAFDADLRTGLAESRDAAGKSLLRAPLRVAVATSELFLDAKQPSSSRGKAKVVVGADGLEMTAELTKGRDALDFDVDAKSPHLGIVRSLLPSELAKKLPIERIGLALRSRGRVEKLASAAPSLEQHTEVRLERPAFDTSSARALSLVLDSKGDALRNVIDGDLRAEGLTIAGTAPSDDHMTFGATIDRELPSLAVHFDATGRLQAKLATTLGFDRSRRALTFDIEGTAARLAALAPLVASVRGARALDLSKLEGSVSAHGALLGAVSDVDRDGNVKFEPALGRSAGLDGTLALKANHVAWNGGGTTFAAPAIAIEAKLRTDGERRTVEGRLDTDELHFVSGPHTFQAGGLHDEFAVTFAGDLADPEIESKQAIAAQVLEQDVLPTYPVGNAAVALAFRRSRDGVIHLSNFEMVNGAGGTSLALKGAIDPSEEQKRLSLRGDLRQNLALLSNAPQRFSGRGTANVTLRVESPDLATFRTIADVRVERADLRLPGYGVVIEEADGEVPITIAVRAGPHGIRMMREDKDNPYSSLRFADQHPLLSRSSFISIRRLTTPLVTVAPIAGNLQIEQNIISLRQFEIGLRGGRVTGQCALNLNGEKSTLDMHLRADGVQSSHGEPFTGSAAIAVSAGDHNIEGRADILQIGKRHLLDLLDLQDPFHTDASINKIRSAMTFGYPDRLRVTFNHGFAGVHVTFGGLAGLVSVGDIRGIPIGPLIDRFVAPLMPAKDEP
ncbi:hypothetical protein AKJ09_07073 [Labilithrix luteola]|uniref:Uncharacterized protein n=1 Tax=Labilithrix luteola TaxID=1391654 RepID=A0A0K1Q4T1_9BACT|nr:hypothetical protein [Labilithrix luteola]AKV00410.1 hypothetical protein AKJ09_07073 [Labilithrix luteola]